MSGKTTLSDIHKKLIECSTYEQVIAVGASLKNSIPFFVNHRPQLIFSDGKNQITAWEFDGKISLSEYNLKEVFSQPV